MIRTIQSVAPDIIITHPPRRLTCRITRETSKAVTNASFYSVCPQFAAAGQTACEKVVPVYFMDTICGVGFAPEEYVDISATLDAKLAMYGKHESQHKYLSAREGTDFFDVIKTSARYRGLQSGARYAEAFARYDVWAADRLRAAPAMRRTMLSAACTEAGMHTASDHPDPVSWRQRGTGSGQRLRVYAGRTSACSKVRRPGHTPIPPGMSSVARSRSWGRTSEGWFSVSVWS